MINTERIPASKQAARDWAILFVRALPECEDVAEAVLVADVAFENLPKDARLSAEWDESKHPRADDGKFDKNPGSPGAARRSKQFRKRLQNFTEKPPQLIVDHHLIREWLDDGHTPEAIIAGLDDLDTNPYDVFANTDKVLNRLNRLHENIDDEDELDDVEDIFEKMYPDLNEKAKQAILDVAAEWKSPVAEEEDEDVEIATPEKTEPEDIPLALDPPAEEPEQPKPGGSSKDRRKARRAAARRAKQ